MSVQNCSIKNSTDHKEEEINTIIGGSCFLIAIGIVVGVIIYRLF